MKQHAIRLCSILLVLALLLNMLPASVFAEMLPELSASTEATLQTDIPKDAATTDAYVVDELVDKRTEFSKEFLLSNGLHMAAVYADAVHYETDDGWAEIDNTLKINADGTLSNTAGVWNVSFPQQLTKNETVTIEKDGYTLSFSLAGQLRSSGELMAATMDASVQEPLSLSQMQLSTGEIQQIDQDAPESGYEYAEMVPEKLSSRLTYNNIYPDTHLVYDLASTKVKESIVMEAYSSSLRGYQYTLLTGEMIPVLEESGQITLYDPNQEYVVMVMPAPYLMDAAEEYNYDVPVQLTGSDGTYTLTYRLPTHWLADENRSWPVILDPVVAANLSISNIKDDTVSEKNEYGYQNDYLEAGHSNARGISRIFLKYQNLPQLTSSDVIVSASVQLYKKVDGNTVPLEVHKVNGTWTSSTLTWSNKPGYNTTIEDYALVGNSGAYSWNITDIVRDWYENQNTGMMFKVSDEIEAAKDNRYKQFYSSDQSTVARRPILTIMFRNNNGLEGYWDYTASSAGRAGTGYINHYTGNLTWIRDDIGFGGNRMPVSIQHVYNLNDAISPSDSNNSNDSGGNSFGMGHGWRTNYNQLVYHWNLSSNSLGDYYIWEDADGTDHYFKKTADNTYEDEDGLNMTLTTNGSGTQKYCITDEKDNKRYFDTNGRLRKIQNNQQTVSSVNVFYTSNTGRLISHITDGVGRTYVFFYNENTRLLEKISYIGNHSIVELYPGADEPPEFNYDVYEEDEISYVSFTYTDSKLIRITDKDGEFSQFGYGANGLLTTAEDIDGYQLTYSYSNANESWQPYRVLSVSEYDSVYEEIGGTLTFAYGHNQTAITDHNGNTELYQFNDFGNTISIQDNEGHATFGTYSRNSENSTEGKANQLRLSSKLQNTVGNMSKYSSFENNTRWAYWPSDTSVVNVNSDAYSGTRSLLFTATKRSCLMSDYFTIEPGATYTFSAYVKGVSGKSTIAIVNRDTMQIEEAVATDGATDWIRAEISYTNTTSDSITGCAQLFGNTGTKVYFDCAQIEKAPTASRYNLAENGDFRYIHQNWIKSANCSSTDTYTTLSTGKAPATQLDNSVFKITGDPQKTKSIRQDVIVSGSEGDSFVMAGWAKGRSAPLSDDNRQFTLRGWFNYTDGSQSGHFDAKFNTATDQWQYVAKPMVATKAYSSVSIAAVYDYNVNTVYFDGIQLYKEEFGSSYTYDPETGDVISVVDLQKKNTTYEYNASGDLTKILEDNKAKVEYTYDSWHNVKTAKTDEDVLYSFEYDGYGNNTKVTIGSGNTTIESSATYTTDGNLLVSTKDALAKETKYGYNINTGVLEWVQYPEDTEATRTNYTYDEMYRMATATCTTDSNLEQEVSYQYVDDRLAEINTPTTDYWFAYDAFGQRTSVSARWNFLAFYTYTDDANRYLQKLTYGNGDYVNYTYDTKGRLLTQTYENGDTVSYAYDNNGALARVTDSATGRTTTYYYDLTDRMMKYTEKGTNFSHTVGYEYDAKNNLTQHVEEINGTAHTTSYTYDDDNRVKTVTTDTSTVEYTYDTLGRIKEKITKHGSSVVLRESYTYTPKSTTESSAQVATHSIIAGTKETLYTYTYDNNGNILSITKQNNTISYGTDNSIVRTPVSTSTTTYSYDSANQLTEERNYATGTGGAWFYDDAGNITSSYELYDDDGFTPYYENIYTYNDAEWGDLLTGYDGAAITYDQIGNPTSYRGWAFAWEHGRQLTSAEKDGTTWDYTYNADGLRTSKTDGTDTWNYVYNGSQLTQMTKGGNTLTFTYDANGTPLTVSLNGYVYYYVTNLQGDVTGIANTNGTLVVSYSYNAWGVCTITSNSTTFALLNPLRYRGYVYDDETGLYYLQSRYYDPEIGRFINGDNYATTGQGFVGNNMFAYCGNNPVCRSDPSGRIWRLVLAVIAVAVVLSGCSSNTNEVLVMSNSDSGWMDSSAIMGDDMADAVDAGSSRVEAITTENFRDVWNQTTENHVIIHTHGSPNLLQGGKLNVKASDISLLQQNSNIKYVLITSCEVGGSNGNNANVGQLISQKIAPDGYVVCSTTIVSGGSKKFTATRGGRWIVYQNGVQISADFSTTITMKDVAAYWH